MNPNARFELALRSPSPADALRAAVLELAQEGHSKDAIYGFLENFLLLQRQRVPRSESDEDEVLDVMDALTGWCHQDFQLL